MRYLLFFFVLLFCQTNFGQKQKYIDSLELVIKDSRIDSVKLSAILSLTYIRGNENKAKHKELIYQGISIAEKSNNLSFKGLFLSEYAYSFRRENVIDSSFYYYKKAQETFIISKDSSKYYYVEYDFGNLKKDQGSYDESLKHFSKGIKFFETQQNETDKKNVLIGRFNVANLYTLLNKNDKAIDEFENLLDLIPQNNENRGLIGISNLNLTGLYIKENKSKLALKSVKKVEELKPAKNTLAHLYSNLGKMYQNLNDSKKALNFFKKSLSYFKQTEDDKGIIIVYNNLGALYLEFNDYVHSEKYLLNANLLLKKMKTASSLIYNYELLSKLYQRKNNYKSALFFKEKQVKLKDSILGLETQKAIADFEVKYETEKTKRDKEVADNKVVISQLESQKNRNLFLASLVIGVLILLLSLFYFSRLKTEKKAELIKVELKETQKRLAIEKQYRDSELKALKAQMNPHFIFNALNSIQDYILLNQRNLASDYLGKFADLIRNYLHFSDTGFISVPDEIQNLNLYLELEKLRFEEELDYSFIVDESVNTDFINIPTMLIQPYIENALKHGLLHKKAGRKLIVSLSKTSDKIIECIIEDNGIGREKSKEINKKREVLHKSFALKATMERLDLLNYGREMKIGVEVIDLKESNKAIGTKVVLKIPILKK
jgi:tetratricopeptide (TPR) repeat protein